jgi:hypothetical protein
MIARTPLLQPLSSHMGVQRLAVYRELAFLDEAED